MDASAGSQWLALVPVLVVLTLLLIIPLLLLRRARNRPKSLRTGLALCLLNPAIAQFYLGKKGIVNFIVLFVMYAVLSKLSINGFYVWIVLSGTGMLFIAYDMTRNRE